MYDNNVKKNKNNDTNSDNENSTDALEFNKKIISSLGDIVSKLNFDLNLIENNNEENEKKNTKNNFKSSEKGRENEENLRLLVITLRSVKLSEKILKITNKILYMYGEKNTKSVEKNNFKIRNINRSDGMNKKELVAINESDRKVIGGIEEIQNIILSDNDEKINQEKEREKEKGRLQEREKVRQGRIEGREEREERVCESILSVVRVWDFLTNSACSDSLAAHGIFLGMEEELEIEVEEVENKVEEGREGEEKDDGKSKKVNALSSTTSSFSSSFSTSSSSSSPFSSSTSSSSSSSFSTSFSTSSFIQLSSASLAASIPVGLRLLDRFIGTDKCLGTYW